MQNSSKTDWTKLAALSDHEIDISDQPELEEAFFERAKLRLPSTILQSAIVDGINRFIRDELIPRGLLDKGRYESDVALDQLKIAIAQSVAKQWKYAEVSRQ